MWRSRPTRRSTHSSWSAMCAPVLQYSWRSPGRAGCAMCAAIYDRSAFIIIKTRENTRIDRVLQAAQLASFCKLCSTYRECGQLFQQSWPTIVLMIERNGEICTESAHNNLRTRISPEERVRPSSCCCRPVHTVPQPRSPPLNGHLSVLVVYCYIDVNDDNYLYVNDAT